MGNASKKKKHEKPNVTGLPEEFSVEGSAVCDVVRAALLDVQLEPGYMTGSNLNAIVAKQAPDAATLVKKAFKGKGWLKKLLAADPSIEEVNIEGKNEPCFKFI